MFRDESEVAARFWSKVDKRGLKDCWEWTGAIDAAGYGILAFKRKNKKAHRISYALAHGGDDAVLLKHDAEGRMLQIAHLCHNRKCVNPNHLDQVTGWENIQQSVAAGRIGRDAPHTRRGGRGVESGTAKLTDDAVREIRRVAFDFDGEVDMMKKYRVGQLAIKSVYLRKSWTHVPE